MNIPNSSGPSRSSSFSEISSDNAKQNNIKQSGTSTSSNQFGHAIRTGDGIERLKFTNEANQFSNFFKSFENSDLGQLGIKSAQLAVVVAPMATVFPLAIPVLAAGTILGQTTQGASFRHSQLEAQSAKNFESANLATLKVLADPSGTLASRQMVIDALKNHAALTGITLNENTIKEYVATGERLATLLLNGNTKGTGKADDPLHFEINGKPYSITSNAYTARALSWYVAAQAARQDNVREMDQFRQMGKFKQDEYSVGQIKDLTVDSEYVMPDPENRIYNFLNAAPTSVTKFSGDPRQNITQRDNTLISGDYPKTNPSQRGIADFQNRFPGQGGAVIFDKYSPPGKIPTLSMKFEQSGSLPLYRNEKNQGYEEKLVSSLAEINRQINDKVNSFLGKNEYKTSDIKQDRATFAELNVTQPFKFLINSAITGGLIAPDAEAIFHSAKDFGFSYMSNTAQKIIDTINELPDELNNSSRVKELAVEFLEQTLPSAAHILDGNNANELMLERRGAEVFVNLAKSNLLS